MSTGSNGSPAPVQRVVRFGVFELDQRRGSLSRAGRPVDLQQQPLLILTYLVTNPGRLVTREELQAHVWPSGTFVEFELGLNAAINRLRRALGDSAAEPRYIETVPKQGYRFICAVSLVMPLSPGLQAAPTLELVPPPLEPATETEELPPPPTTPVKPNRWTRPQVALLALTGAILGAILTYLWAATHTPVPSSLKQVYHFTLTLPAGHNPSGLAISPAGDQIVYASEHGESRMLYRRFFEEDQSRPIPGTENAHSPFFSPDGASLGFYTPGKLQVLTASGIHTLVTLSPSFDRWNAIWADDGFIYFNGTIPGSNCWIWRVRALGGTPERLMDAGHDPHGDSFSFPTQLISGSHPKLLLSVDSGPVRRSVNILDLKTRSTSLLLERAWGCLLLPTGHLLYYRDGSVFATPFDSTQMKPTGTPTELLTDVQPRGWVGPQASISNTGTIVYLKDPPVVSTQLEWLDTAGHATPLPLAPAHYEQAEVSPDGSKLALVQREEASRWSLWIYNLRSGSLVHLLDSKLPRLNAIWSPDSASLVVSLAHENGDFVNLFRLSIANPQSLERLTEQPNFGQFPQSWSSAAHAILFMEGVHGSTNGDIMVLPLNGDRQPKPLVATPGWDRMPSFSPDGKWFVYDSEQAGTSQVFVQAYDAPQAKVTGPAIQISPAGGIDPVWASDGRTIYYLDRENQMMAANLNLHTAKPTRIQKLFAANISRSNNLWTRSYSIAPDGRFLVMSRPKQTTETSARIQVIVNWFDEIKRLTNTR